MSIRQKKTKKKLVNYRQCQGHQTYDENLDLEQDYNHATFERSRFNSVQEKDNVFFFLLLFLKRE